MRRSILSIAGCLLLACAVFVLAPTVDARPSSAMSAGAISGVVVNGTRQNSVVTGQKVTLQRSVGISGQDIATTTTDSAGRFSFGNLPANPDDIYAVYAEFQGGMFASQTVKVGDAGAAALQLKVYDTTNDDAQLRVTVATLLARQPRPLNGLMSLGEIVSIENTGTTAFVGTPTGDASRPMRLLRFATPPNASNLSLGIGFAGSQIITTDKGFGSTATVPPGTTDFAFALDIPYTGTTADLSYKAVYPTAQVVMLIPPDMFVSSKDFAAKGLVDSLGSRYQLFSAANTTAGREVSVQVTGLPEAGEKSNLDARALTILAAILALLALLVLLFYLRRGNIAAALGLIAPQHIAGDKTPAAGDVARSTDPGERERLLHELLTLERSHAAGSVTDIEFQQRGRELRLRLRAVLASETGTTSAEAHAEQESASGAADATTGVGDNVREVSTSSEQSGGGRR